MLMEELRAECRLCNQLITFNKEGFVTFGDRITKDSVKFVEYKNSRYVVCPTCQAIVLGLLKK